MKSNPTLHEIAVQVGVSDMTVSRVLTGSYVPKRADAVRRAERIKKLARQMGYRPNIAGRAMRTGTFGAIGILNLIDPTTTVINLFLLKEMQVEIMEHDLHPVMGQTTVEELLGDSPPRVIRELMVDALIINFPMKIAEGVKEHLSGIGLPVIHGNVVEPYDTVHPDDELAGRQLTEYLIERGHTRIAFVNRVQTGHYSCEAREAGYVAAMKAAQLPVQALDPPAAITADEGYRQHYAFFRGLLSRPDRPTAVVSYEAKVVIAYQQAAQDLGLDFPGDAAFVAFGDQEPSCMFHTVTLMKVPHTAIGKAIVTMAQQKIKNPETKIPAVAIPFDFIEGSTAGRLA